MTIDYLAIGHICADLQPDGSTRLGGTALFAALTAYRLGLRAAILTACGPDLDLSSLPRDLPVLRQPSTHSTVFENRYGPAGRTQLLHARAATICLDHGAATAEIPGWQRAPIVHLAPVMQDVPQLDATALFPDAIVGATPQGWLRSVDSAGLVTTSPADLLLLPLVGVRAVIFSEEDIQGDEWIARRLADRIPLVVLTRAERGATLLTAGSETDVPAARAAVIDPTGAGDVFAAAFLSALHGGSGPIDAVRWACAAAACAIEAPGIEGLPTAETVRRRLRSF